jgi:hypothetical protein
VIIKGQSKFKCLFQIAKPVYVNLVNLKITNFEGDVIGNLGSIKVNNCIFTDNIVDGAIIANYNGINCKITNSIFTKNTFNHVKNSAGVAIYNDNVASLSITSVVFRKVQVTKL